MSLANPDIYLLDESFRWFGPDDPVPLAYITQAGVSAVFTSLHQISCCDPWPNAAIRERRAVIEAAGLRWTVAESVPVHENIKTGSGDSKRHFGNYASMLCNLASEGVYMVIDNFKPVLHWVDTEMSSVLPDGSGCLGIVPGYLCIGRMGGLAELRGLILGLQNAERFLQ